MTLTFAYENATRPKRSGVWRRFTQEEDAILRTMCDAGASYNQIAAALGRKRNSVNYRALTLGITKAPVRPGPGAKHAATATATASATHCIRCAVLLSCAPAGRGGQCGYCVAEVTP